MVYFLLQGNREFMVLGSLQSFRTRQEIWLGIHKLNCPLLHSKASVMAILIGWVQVIEYTGELVRPPIADKREHLIYNSMVVRI